MKELLNKLPSSWEQVTLKQFQDLALIPITEDGTIFDGIENSIAVISYFTGLSIDELESMSMIDLGKLGNKLNWMVTPPESTKESIIKWKKVEEISYSDYLTFIAFKDKQIENLHVFIKAFSHTTLSQEEILQLPTTECVTGFFLFRKQLRQSLKASIKSTKIQLAKQLVKQKLHTFKQKMKM